MNDKLHCIAYDAIAEIFGLASIDKSALLREYPELNDKKATFVTIKKNGNLRGCIGSLLPNKSLLEDIIANAQSCAFRDLRFDILKKDELDFIDIEISILTMPSEVKYVDRDELKSKIRPNIDGVILQLDNNQATFLPQVWEELKTFEEFFDNLCQKAGCTKECLEQNPNIYTYQVDKIQK